MTCARVTPNGRDREYTMFPRAGLLPRYIGLVRSCDAVRPTFQQSTCHAKNGQMAHQEGSLP